MDEDTEPDADPESESTSTDAVETDSAGDQDDPSERDVSSDSTTSGGGDDQSDDEQLLLGATVTETSDEESEETTADTDSGQATGTHESGSGEADTAGTDKQDSGVTGTSEDESQNEDRTDLLEGIDTGGFGNDEGETSEDIGDGAGVDATEATSGERTVTEPTEAERSESDSTESESTVPEHTVTEKTAPEHTAAETSEADVGTESDADSDFDAPVDSEQDGDYSSETAPESTAGTGPDVTPESDLDTESDTTGESNAESSMPGVPDPEPSDKERYVPEDVQKYARFKKMDGAQYDRVNEFLRDRTYVTAREWAIARLCSDFRTETGIEMTKIGENLPELVPFMTDTYTPQAVNQARSSFETKVRKSGATFLYGAMCDFFTAEELDDVMYEATEVAKFLLEVEGVDLSVEDELDAEERISSVMREVREASKELREDDES